MRQRHWLHPQTVPRGFLRLYILTLLSREPQSGYSIIQIIDDKTEGAWRPGPGTMYPLLKSLQREGLVAAKGRGWRARKTYSLTPKGTRELDEVRKLTTGAGRKDAVMGRLFGDLLPGDVFVPLMVRRLRDGSDFLREKVTEIPEPQRTPLLREMRLVLASQVDWIDSQLRSEKAKAEAQA